MIKTQIPTPMPGQTMAAPHSEVGSSEPGSPAPSSPEQDAATRADTAPAIADDDTAARLLNAAGERVPNAELEPWASELDAEAIGGLYRDMVVVRRLDTEGVALQRQGQLGLWPPLLGQEAAQIGSARALRRRRLRLLRATARSASPACAAPRPADLMRAWRGIAALAAGTRRRQHGDAADHHRRAVAARRRATRWASRSTAPTRSPSPTSATGRPARAM